MKLMDINESVNSCPDLEMEDDKSSMEGVAIRRMDVLCGRGKNSFNHG
jgi:hypothetical protein